MERKMGPARSWYFVRFWTSIRLILTLLVWRLLRAVAAGQNETVSEAQILLDFRNFTSSAYGDYNPRGLWFSWTDTDTPCAWVGVDCTADSNIVEGLDFSGWGLDPNMPGLYTLSALTGLRRLDLSSNGVPFLNSLAGLLETDYPGAGWPTFDIPDDIGNFTNLTHLDLSGNFYEGEIRDFISRCKNLRELYLNDNQLGGDISALAGIASLETLHLANNQLNSSFPIFEKKSSLVVLDLSNNQFTGNVSDLSNLPNLRILNLDGNNFETLDGSFFAHAKSLEHLSVSGNLLAGSLPASVGNMSNLQVLNLSNNHLSGPIPSEIAGNISSGASYFTLDLSSNSFTGSIPANLIGRPLLGLVSVNISHNRLTGNISSIIEELSPGQGMSIFSLDVSHNQLSGTVPPVTRNFNGSTYSMFLNDNQFYGDVVDWLVDMPGNSSFSRLEMQNNHFTGDISRIAAAKLQRYAFWSESLVVLDLSNNDLRWTTSEAIQNPLSLFLQNLPVSLSMLRIGGNNFSGISLPTGVKWSSDYLELLDLSNNHLIGEISGAVFSGSWLPALQVLNLSNNQATGGIPIEIDSLQNLTDFYVYNNRLSGSLSFIKPGSRLYFPSFFSPGNNGLCDGPLPPCNSKSGVPRWVVAIIVSVSMIMVIGSFLTAAWRWKVYNERHQQDAELIRTIREGESATLMSLRDLERATNNFADSEQIGEGGFGKVYRGTLSNGIVVAIKRSKREGFKKDKEQFLNEVRILTQLNHRYLLELLGCCMENQIALLVFEFVSNGTLQDHLQQKCGGGHLSWKERLKIAVQTADALNYLHSAAKVPIHHRDVKSANILLSDDLNAKVADFGISKVAPVEATHASTMVVQGTFGYIDPEYYTSLKFTDRSDVYSFSVVLLELISAKPAIDFSRCEEERSLVVFAKPHIESGDLDELIDPSLMENYRDPAGHGKESILSVGRLAVKCLSLISKARPSMQDVFKELQSLQLSLLEVEDKSLSLETMNEDAKEDPHHNYIDFLAPDSPFDSRSTSSLENVTVTIEMSQLS